MGGLIAGFINTLAGNGSALTLGLLTEVIGLPGNIANGTNRVGILAQCLSASYRFNRNGLLDIRKNKSALAWIVLGASLGIFTATQISNESFREVFKFLIFAMLIALLIKPKKWLRPSLEESHFQSPWAPFLLVPIGFYGGFIQMGMGVVALMVFVLIGKMNLMRANAFKVFAISVYTLIALSVFIVNDMIDWKIGGIIAVGQFAGGWLAAEFGSKWKHANTFSYWLLVTIISGLCLWLIFQSFQP